MNKQAYLMLSQASGIAPLVKRILQRSLNRDGAFLDSPTVGFKSNWNGRNLTSHGGSPAPSQSVTRLAPGMNETNRLPLPRAFRLIPASLQRVMACCAATVSYWQSIPAPLSL